MSEMVERVARAMADYEGYQWDYLDETEPTFFGNRSRKSFREEAEEVIAAIDAIAK